MISDVEADFLSSALGEVTRREPVAAFPFTEPDIDEIRSRSGSGSDDSSNVNRFFTEDDYEICQNCRRSQKRCDCDITDLEQTYLLDSEYIVQEWCECVESLDLYEEAFIEVEGTFQVVKAVSREFGVLTFWMVSDSSQLTDLSPSITAKEFVVSLVEAQEVGERDNHFMWYNLLTISDHENLHSVIREAFALPFERICDLDSEATMDNINAIQTNIQKYLYHHDFYDVDAQQEAGGAGQVLDFTEVDFGVQDDDGVVVTCRCDKSASDIHLHYIVDGDLQQVSDSRIAEKAGERMRDRITRLETLRQNAYELSGRMRAAILAGAAVSLGPLVSTAAGFVNLTGLNLSDYPFSSDFFVSGLLLLIFLALLIPSARLTFFSWDLRRIYVRIWDNLMFWD
jgi:hypothetical protein